MHATEVARGRLFKRRSNPVLFPLGLALSCIGHLLAVFIAILMIESSDAKALRRQEVFTVSLEGGKSIGGISHVSDEKEKSKVAPPVVDSSPVDKTSREEKRDSVEPEDIKKVVERDISQPTVVEDPEKIKALQEAEKQKIEAEKKRLKQEKEEKEKKLREEREKQAEEEKKRKQEAEKKRQEDELKKKRQEEERKRQEEERKKEQEKRARREREDKLKKAIEKSASRYKGNSADAGGSGIGAAKIGGNDRGGGTLASVEFIRYRNALEAHIKGGWHWLAGTERLSAQVSVAILPDGVIQNAEILQSSGRSGFDESVLRAVYKASPVPAPPASLRDKFREVRIVFDSHE